MIVNDFFWGNLANNVGGGGGPRLDAERALELSRELRDADPEQDALGYANAQMRLAHVDAALRRWDLARDLAASATDWMATTGQALGSKLHLSTARTWRRDLRAAFADAGLVLPEPLPSK